MTTRDSIGSTPAHTRHTMTRTLGKLADAALLVALVVLAVTGIGTFMLGRAPMTGWVLMLHVALAPLFAVGLVVMAVIWAAQSQFDGDSSRQNGAGKAFFWLALLSGSVVILSGVTPMTPVFGTHGQHTLYLLHRYSAMVLAAALVLHWLNRRPERPAA